MSADHDLERRIADLYGSEAPTRAPDWVLGAILASVDTTPQRRGRVPLPRRFEGMNTYLRLAAAAAAIVAVTVGGVVILRPGSDPGVGGGPSPSPSPDASPTTSPTATPLVVALDDVFTSDRNGLSVAYPSGWVVRRATPEPWTTGIPFLKSPFADVATPTRGDEFLLVASQDLAGRDGAAWADEIAAKDDWGDDCDPASTPVTIDGERGVRVVRCDGTQTAMAWVDDRGYLVVLYGMDDSTGLFDAIIASVQLQPEDAAESP